MTNDDGLFFDGAEQSIQDITDLQPLIDTAFQINYESALEIPHWIKSLVRELHLNQREIEFPFPDNNMVVRSSEEGTPVFFQGFKGRKVKAKWRKIHTGIYVPMLDWLNPVTQQMMMQDFQSAPKLMVLKPYEHIMDAFNEGEINPDYITYDGKQLFAEDHDIKGNVFSNLNYNMPLTSDNFGDAKTQMMDIPWGPDGRPLRNLTNVKFYLIVPTNLTRAAHHIIHDTILPNDEIAKSKTWENPNKGMAEVIVDPGLTDPNDWFLVMVPPGMIPFIHLKHQKYSNPSLVAYTDAKDLNVRDHDEYLWYAKTFEVIIPVHFWLMQKNVASPQLS